MLFFFIKNKGFPESRLHWDRKSHKYRIKLGSRTCLVNPESKEHILPEASTLFDFDDEQLVFHDGTEILMNLIWLHILKKITSSICQG